MTSFNDTWAPTWKVQETIPRARACIIENTGRTFRSGRPIVDAVFFDGNRREICRRTGMRLTSKKGDEYVVCKREPDGYVTTTTAPAQPADVPSADVPSRHPSGRRHVFTAADVFDD